MNKNKIKVIAGIVIVFLLGALIGSLGTGIYFNNRIRNYVKGGRPFPIKRFFMKRVSDFDLTQVQQAEIEEIVNNLQKELFEFRLKSKPEAEKIIDRNISLIKEKLNSEQKQKLDNLLKEYNQKRLDRRKHRRKKMSPDDIMNAVKKRLKLTPEQEKQIQPIIKDQTQKFLPMFEKYRKEGREARQLIRSEIREYLQNAEKDLKNILTEEQLRELKRFWREQRRSDHKGHSKEKEIP
ncbi:MAG: hypothetical protein GY795_13205 [Desulfobacterales bacterium]|nr:hypothetical protein [Desulfobacterales bacterium]